jgi:hypothetical protein
MIREKTFQHFKRLWPIIGISGAFISAAFIVDWIGLSAPGKFSLGQIVLVVIGLLILVIGVLGRRIATVYRGAAILLLNTIVILVCLELAAAVTIKILDQFPSTPAPETQLPYYRSQVWSKEYWREFDKAQSSMYVPCTINISEDGIRLTPGANCTPGSYKVFTFGGSTMWGWGTPDWGTIPAYLQAGLESLREEPVCVVNFGEVAYVSTHDLIELMIQLRSGNVPDLVIFYDGLNDVIASGASGKAGVHQNLDGIALRFKEATPKHPLILWLNQFYL